MSRHQPFLSSIFLADINGDGQTDLFFVCASEGACGACNAGARLSLPDGGYGAPVCFLDPLVDVIAVDPEGLLFGDVDGDTCKDLVLALPSSLCPNVSIYHWRNASSDWAPKLCTAVPIEDHESITILLEDVTGDLRADLVRSHDPVCRGLELFTSVWPSDGSTFSTRHCLDMSVAMQWGQEFAAVIDMDGDGTKEILSQTTEQKQAVVMLLSDGF